jgi:hypothetical protein
MKNVDFLPARYREKNAQRKTQAWRGGVAAAFAGLLAAGWLGQLEIRSLVQAQLDDVRRQYDHVTDQGRKIAALQSELREARAEAELLTYLRHPWPRTQLLASIAAPLTEAITLRKVAIRQEEKFASPLAAPAVANAAAPGGELADAKAAAAALPRAERTLKKLREALDEAPLTVTLEGVSRDSAALHVYVGKLAESEWFSEAELRSVERLADDQPAALRFVARLVVRPGYGHPRNPPLGNELTESHSKLAAGSP